MQIKRLLLLSAVILWAAPLVVNAATTNYVATGIAQSSDSAYGIVAGVTGVTLSFSYNPSQGFESGFGTNEIGYGGAISNVSVGGLTGQTLLNDTIISVADVNSLGFSGESIEESMKTGSAYDFLVLNLPTATSGTSLPVSLPSLSSLNSTYVGSDPYFNLGLVFQDPNGHLIDMGLTSLSETTPVPIPAAAWLLVSALGGFAGFRRKRIADRV